MTLGWVIAGAVVGLLSGPPIRAVVFAGSTSAGQGPRCECPDCSSEVLPGPVAVAAGAARHRALPRLPGPDRAAPAGRRDGSGRCAGHRGRSRVIRVGLAALAWLALIAVPLALIDVAVHRLPDRLTAPAFAGTLALLTVAALTAHQPDRLARATIGAAALACFYLALCRLRPGQMGLGDAKIAASIG